MVRTRAANTATQVYELRDEWHKFPRPRWTLVITDAASSGRVVSVKEMEKDGQRREDDEE
jgi:hypothetical protein